MASIDQKVTRIIGTIFILFALITNAKYGKLLHFGELFSNFSLDKKT